MRLRLRRQRSRARGISELRRARRLNSKPMNFEQILEYLQANQWPIERLSGNTARSRCDGKTRSFPFFVHADSTYMILLCVPYARLPGEEARANKLMDRLLGINRELMLAKFAVDDDGDIVLSVEYPLADLQVSELRDALNVLGFYAEKHWDEVSSMARAPGS
jgi:hypothetical protein